MKKQTDFLSLIRQVHLRFAKFFSRKLAKENITLPQYMLLMILMEEGAQKMNSVAKLLQISTPSVTNLVDKLEASDFARRIPHPGDRRAHIIEITQGGERFVNNFRKEALNLLADIIDRMSPADQDVLRKFYKELICGLDAAIGR